MTFFDFLTLLGGLALFLYGMDKMGSSLTHLSGNKLEGILKKLTTNKYNGMLLGLLVTALIQSSSGTTVMVVGFVNSGIMQLSQATGVIIGANIGTTVTSWILSLTGVEGSSFFLQLLKPSSFAPIIALIGVIMLFKRKQTNQHKNIAGVMLGFAILMFGMHTMSGAVAPLANVPEFADLFVFFKNPILGIVVGTVVTALIQSSSASVGILQALCATGSITYAAAVPIIMGQNIGTCVTALISSIGASKNGKRAAYIHLCFNLLGTVIFGVVFYTINIFKPFAFLNDTANYFGIALFHTAFNLVVTAVLLPLSKVLEIIACFLVKKDSTEDQEENEFKLLDPRFVNQPAVAIEQSHTLMMKMAELCELSFDKAYGLINHYDNQVYDEVERLENRIDKYEDAINIYMIEISKQEMSEKLNQQLNMMIASIHDFERISDHAMNIAENAQAKHNFHQTLTEHAQRELDIYATAIRDIIKLSKAAFTTFDNDIAIKVEPLEETIDVINKTLGNRHIIRMKAGYCSVEMGIHFSDLLTNMERIADHCSNIAIAVIESQTKIFDRHDYIEHVHNQESYFKKQFEEYKQVYQLPVDAM